MEIYIYSTLKVIKYSALALNSTEKIIKAFPLVRYNTLVISENYNNKKTKNMNKYVLESLLSGLYPQNLNVHIVAIDYLYRHEKSSFPIKCCIF